MGQEPAVAALFDEDAKEPVECAVLAADIRVVRILPGPFGDVGLGAARVIRLLLQVAAEVESGFVVEKKRRVKARTRLEGDQRLGDGVVREARHVGVHRVEIVARQEAYGAYALELLVQVPVLGAGQGDVEAADGGESVLFDAAGAVDDGAVVEAALETAHGGKIVRAEHDFRDVQGDVLARGHGLHATAHHGAREDHVRVEKHDVRARGDFEHAEIALGRAFRPLVADVVGIGARNGLGVVAAAVVHDDDLERLPGIVLGGDGGQASADIFGFVFGGDHHRDSVQA
ncbi:hypothetical protein DSECCO2_574440 [anaerobic digester metagenome]